MVEIRKIVALFVFMFSFCASVADICADTHGAASCSFADVSTAITAASRGDTVLVPAGTSTWSSILTITKGIYLKGNGIGSTVINSVQSSIIVYEPDATARTNNERFDLSGFTFNGNNTGGRNGLVYIHNETATAISKVVIHHNGFYNVNTTSCKGLNIEGNVYGVAYLNQFVDVGYIGNFVGWGYESWTDYPFSYGTANNFYMEDNSMSMTKSLFYSLWTEGGQGGRYSLRYNTYDFTNYARTTSGAIGLWDLHGDQGDAGGMGFEAYGNNIINVSNSQSSSHQWYADRGGQSLVYFNKWSGDMGGNFDIQENHQCSPEQVLNTYYWSNYFGTELKNGVEDYDCCGCLAKNAQFWNQNLSYNGTTQIGIYCGSSLPAHCTVGDGAWITTQSCSDMTGLVGYEHTTDITGTFYRCTAKDTWTAYYKPYTYPHPLRAPNIVMGLKIK